MRRKVVLEDEYGDRQTGVEHPARMSDEPGTITVNGTNWYTTVWHAHGWRVVSAGEWEE
ncbi:hypothetical protein SAMN05428970_1989 [Agromyces sp. CF514]|uniref:hypothetical protein n=1 Tax=Agromyces sp. CF514 TaxID=1881031 RepID=UPI0008EE6F78|nr:hypothetical protein [Agromyces sp. CF514]SFR75914.1 hypothetical protein SAMN05428970_1989 [Agromyces sp. CF514]